MKVAIIGASGKTGRNLVRESLSRGWHAVAVCRDVSAEKLDEFAGHEGFTLVTAPVISDKTVLTGALSGCDAVVAVLLSIFRLKATELVKSLAKAGAEAGVARFVFTAGEVTAVREEGESYTLRQWLLFTLVPPLLGLTPVSMADMLKSSELVRQQPGWQWTIVRAPALKNTPPTGYRLCKVSEVNSAHILSREDYAACLLDSVDNPEHHGRVLTVVGANG